MLATLRHFAFALCLATASAVALHAAPAHSQEAPEPATVPELVKALEGTYRNVSSLRADFVQVVRSPVAGELRQKGKVQVKKPRKARWDFVSEPQSHFITDGKQIWLYTPASKQVIVMNDLSQAGGADLGVLLDDLGKLDQKFNLKLLAGGGADKTRSYVVEASPKDGGAKFKKVELAISRKKYMLERVTITGTMGEVTELTFSGIKLNSPMQDAEFSFTAPAGVQVIQSGM
jgi:chaperone LolA